MASPENIFLHLSAAEEQQVRDVFTLLEERGVPCTETEASHHRHFFTGYAGSRSSGR